MKLTKNGEIVELENLITICAFKENGWCEVTEEAKTDEAEKKPVARKNSKK